MDTYTRKLQPSITLVVLSLYARLNTTVATRRCLLVKLGVYFVQLSLSRDTCTKHNVLIQDLVHPVLCAPSAAPNYAFHHVIMPINEIQCCSKLLYTDKDEYCQQECLEVLCHNNAIHGSGFVCRAENMQYTIQPCP